MSMDDEPRKVDPSTIQVIGTHGEVVQEAKDSKKEAHYQDTPFGRVRVIQGGPWALLLLPIAIPLILVALVFLMIFALFFGRGIFKVVTRGMNRS